MNEEKQSKYVPEVGDLLEWNGEEFFCIETGTLNGTVAPNESCCSYVISNFYWESDGISAIFKRKASPIEMESLGLTIPLPNN